MSFTFTVLLRGVVLRQGNKFIFALIIIAVNVAELGSVCLLQYRLPG